MKQLIAALALALTLAAGSASALAANALAARPVNPVDQFTGIVWMQTSRENKAMVLFGSETAITGEYLANSKGAGKAAKEGKAPSSTLSRFDKGWMTAMKDSSREKIIDTIDAWYAAHPDKQAIPVMNVICFSLIKPVPAASK